MQFQADVLGVPVALGELAETTALGAAYLAGVGADLWTVSDLRGEHGRAGRARARGAMSRAWARTSAPSLLAGWADALARASGRGRRE